MYIVDFSNNLRIFYAFYQPDWLQTFFSRVLVDNIMEDTNIHNTNASIIAQIIILAMPQTKENHVEVNGGSASVFSPKNVAFVVNNIH